ncbi:MAG: sulfurtransferase [Flavobacteriaceae bacterium]|nr:MAG: sulfurtransferase [Flavobacteriaceae bacterium]
MSIAGTNIKSVEWLYNNLNTKHLVILDASMPKATDKNTSDSTANYGIKGTRFFDIKTAFSDTTAAFPNTLPSAEKFTASAQQLGINNDSIIVVYDRLGIYSSARAWYLFKAMGHKNVVVLDGGLPAWEKAGYPIEKREDIAIKPGDFQANYAASYFYNATDVLSKLNDDSTLILDARTTDRFEGSVAEPREGLRSGHIPSSKSMPFASLLQEGYLLANNELEKIFTLKETHNKALVFTCGSGVTACVLALAATEVGLKNIKVYDGSWTEWGSRHELPIVSK